MWVIETTLSICVAFIKNTRSLSYRCLINNISFFTTDFYTHLFSQTYILLIQKEYATKLFNLIYLNDMLAFNSNSLVKILFLILFDNKLSFY